MLFYLYLRRLQFQEHHDIHLLVHPHLRPFLLVRFVEYIVGYHYIVLVRFEEYIFVIPFRASCWLLVRYEKYIVGILPPYR